LRPLPDYSQDQAHFGLTSFHNIIGQKCHELYLVWRLAPTLWLALLLVLPAAGQLKTRTPHPGAPEQNIVNISATRQEVDGPWRRFRGAVRLETSDSLLTADEVDYNDDTKDAVARGHVHFEHYVNGDIMDCDHAEYNTDDETGKFYIVHGTSPAKVQSRPGILTSSNPFYFEGKWAERIESKYVLHDGFITDCKVPKPWWRLTGPKFDIVPNQRALAYRTIFRIRGMPLFYAPVLYKSLKKNPRKSGLLTPNIGHSTTRGYMVGGGYYWAINRSYDLTYRGQYFTERGVAHDVGFRGKVRPGTDISATIYGVNDKGLKQDDGSVQKASGFNLVADARSDLGHGWFFRGQLNYLSSFLFRQTFTESFHEAVNTESHSVGYLAKHWSTWGVNAVVQRDENFLDVGPRDKILIRKLPEVEFLSREREISHSIVPLYFSLDSTAGLVDRDQPDPAIVDETLPPPLRLQTRRYVDRLDIYPHISTAFHWKGFDIFPTFGVRETEYGSSIRNNQVIGADVLRNAREVNIELIPPPLARIYKAPKWLGNDRVKHVIELRAKYRLVDGIDNFNNIVRFDEVDLMSNTNEVQIHLTNRLYVKNKDGNVNEALTWELSQSRYFDPTFGGAVIAGQRNVVESESDLTGFAFLNGPRTYSPVESTLRYQQRLGVEWRSDYDPLYGHIVNSGVTVDGRFAKYFVSVGHTQVRSDPILTAPSNQFRSTVGWGDPNRRGWNAGFSVYYDYKKSVMQFATTQVTYNTDCCGLSVQYRKLNFGTRDETQFRVAFAISNVATFGTLKRQERIF
jgi:LPS-assembly protein